jgi:hypothetical protein
MIVQRHPHTLLLMTQPDHARLAGRLMRHWRPLQQSPRRDEILLAIDEHDNGWREPDAAPSVDPTSGRLYDFVTAPAAVRQGVWPRAIERLQHTAWAAALVAEHAITVYDRYRSDPEWADFFANLERSRDRLLTQAGRSHDKLAADYPFVRIGDLLSLMFCNRWDQETFGGWTFMRDDNHLMVTPDALDEQRIPFSITARRIPDRTYGSDDDLRDTLRDAPEVTLEGTMSSR